MAETTKIEWTDSTMNPWLGCTAIAPACDHCYAEAMDKRMGKITHWGNVPRRRTSAAYWQQPLKWQRDADKFMAEHGRARRVFCASMADVFDNQVPTEWRDDLWALIRQCPGLDWQLLTKRPQNIAGVLPSFWDEVKSHVWLGTTVEDQKHADLNIPHLLQHDSAVRFISAEPLLGPIDLTLVRETTPTGIEWRFGLCAERAKRPGRHYLDWVITGGESGPHARPASIQWYRSLRDQCKAAGVPFNFKQWGEWHPAGPHHADDPGRFAFGDYEHGEAMGGGYFVRWDRYPRQFDMFGARSVMQWVGKKAAGRTLDGVTHDGFPVVHL